MMQSIVHEVINKHHKDVTGNTSNFYSLILFSKRTYFLSDMQSNKLHTKSYILQENSCKIFSSANLFFGLGTINTKYCL